MFSETMGWREHWLQISLKRYTLFVEDKVAAGNFERAANYGRTRLLWDRCVYINAPSGNIYTGTDW